MWNLDRWQGRTDAYNWDDRAHLRAATPSLNAWDLEWSLRATLTLKESMLFGNSQRAKQETVHFWMPATASTVKSEASHVHFWRPPQWILSTTGFFVSSGTLADNNPLTSYEPNILDDFHCSETNEVVFQEDSCEKDTEPSYLRDAELDDETIGKALSSPHHCSFRSETNQRTEDKLITLMKKVCCQLSPFSHTQERGDPCTNLLRVNENPVAKWKTKESGFSLKDKKEQILSDVRTEIQKHEFQADSDGRTIQEQNGIIESQRREVEHTLAGDEQLRRDQLLLHEQLSEPNRDLREAHMKSLLEMEELKRVQGSRFDEFSRRRLIENQDTINELTAKIQDLQNEVNCLDDSIDFQDAESVRSGLFHVPRQPALLPLFRDPGGMPSRLGRMLSRNDKPPDIWDTHGKSGKRFFVNPPISNVTEHKSPHVTSGRQTTDTTLDPRCQSEPSARNSVVPNEGKFSKDYGVLQKRLQISDLHFDKFPTPATFACWKIRFKTEVCTCSQFPTEALLWIKEVEMVESVDDL